MERFASNRIRVPIGAVLLAVILAGCDDDIATASSSVQRALAATSPAGAGSNQPAIAAGSLKAVTLSLTPPTETIDGTPLWSGLAGYRIYWGTSIGQYPHSATIANPGVSTYVVENLDSATWYFVATVITTDGVESDFSDPLSVAL